MVTGANSFYTLHLLSRMPSWRKCSVPSCNYYCDPDFMTRKSPQRAHGPGWGLHRLDLRKRCQIISRNRLLHSIVIAYIHEGGCPQLQHDLGFPLGCEPEDRKCHPTMGHLSLLPHTKVVIDYVGSEPEERGWLFGHTHQQVKGWFPSEVVSQ